MKTMSDKKHYMIHCFDAAVAHWQQDPQYFCNSLHSGFSSEEDIYIIRCYMKATGLVNVVDLTLHFHAFLMHTDTRYSVDMDWEEFYPLKLSKNLTLEMIFYRVRMIEELRQELICKAFDEEGLFPTDIY